MGLRPTGSQMAPLAMSSPAGSSIFFAVHSSAGQRTWAKRAEVLWAPVDQQRKILQADSLGLGRATGSPSTGEPRG